MVLPYQTGPLGRSRLSPTHRSSRLLGVLAGLENKPVNETSTVVASDHARALFNVTQTSRTRATKF